MDIQSTLSSKLSLFLFYISFILLWLSCSSNCSSLLSWGQPGLAGFSGAPLGRGNRGLEYEGRKTSFEKSQVMHSMERANCPEKITILESHYSVVRLHQPLQGAPPAHFLRDNTRVGTKASTDLAPWEHLQDCYAQCLMSAPQTAVFSVLAYW